MNVNGLYCDGFINTLLQFCWFNKEGRSQYQKRDSVDLEFGRYPDMNKKKSENVVWCPINSYLIQPTEVITNSIKNKTRWTLPH